MVPCGARGGGLPRSRNDLSWNDARHPSPHPPSQAQALILNSTRSAKMGAEQVAARYRGCLFRPPPHTHSANEAQRLVGEVITPREEGDLTQY